jgi:hypothetical protein
MLVASMEPQVPNPERRLLIEERMKSLIPAQHSKITNEILESRITSPAGVDRMLAATPPVINTDHNRWLEYSTPPYNASTIDWISRNIAFLRSFDR